MILILICDKCGAQFPYDSDEIESCGWCGKDICIMCEVKHDCINEKDDDDEN